MAILLLTGCGKHHVPEEGISGALSGSYIFFDAGVVETKGTIISGTTLPGSVNDSKFGVFGFRENGDPVFDRYKTTGGYPFDNVANVYRTGYQLPFKYDLLSLWHNGQHTFYGFLPWDAGKTVITSAGLDNSSRPYISYAQPVSLEAMKDVLTGSKQATKEGGDVVIPMEHRLFSFYVKLNNNQDESEREIIVKSAKVNFFDIASTADLYFDDTDADGYPDMAVGSGVTHPSHEFVLEPKTLSYGSSLEFNKNNSIANPFLFLPCNSLKVKVSITLVNAWGEETELVVDCSTDETALTPTGGFLPGKKYTMNINKTDKDIYFSLENAEIPWETPEAGDNIDIGFN